MIVLKALLNVNPAPNTTKPAYVTLVISRTTCSGFSYFRTSDERVRFFANIGTFYLETKSVVSVNCRDSVSLTMLIDTSPGKLK
jgi:hypothetical protein